MQSSMDICKFDILSVKSLHEVPNSLFLLAFGIPLCIINLLSFRESEVLGIIRFHWLSSLRIISRICRNVFFMVLCFISSETKRYYLGFHTGEGIISKVGTT